MIQQKLKSKWSIWINYSQGKKKSATTSDFRKNLRNVVTFDSLLEFAYIWKHTDFCRFDTYFTNFSQQSQSKFILAEGEEPYKMEAINYFKDLIEPTWQYGTNALGGQFLLYVGRQEADTICQKVLLYILGDLLPMSDEVYLRLNRIAGVRFVDRINFSQGISQVRVEIWVKFCTLDGERIQNFMGDLLEMANKIGWKVQGQPQFRDSK